MRLKNLFVAKIYLTNSRYSRYLHYSTYSSPTNAITLLNLLNLLYTCICMYIYVYVYTYIHTYIHTYISYIYRPRSRCSPRTRPCPVWTSTPLKSNPYIGSTRECTRVLTFRVYTTIQGWMSAPCLSIYLFFLFLFFLYYYTGVNERTVSIQGNLLQCQMGVEQVFFFLEKAALENNNDVNAIAGIMQEAALENNND